MIKGNTMDVFTIAFDNGDQFSLMARDKAMARFMAHELVPNCKIIAIHKVDEWQDNA